VIVKGKNNLPNVHTKKQTKKKQILRHMASIYGVFRQEALSQNPTTAFENAF